MNIIALCTLLTAHFTITVKAFTLQTTFNNDAGTAGGNMFDVQNVGSWPVHIESFDVNIWKPPSQPDMTVTIYTKSNSYKTFETNSNAWTLIHTQIYTSPRNAGSVTKLGSLSTPLIINTGSIQALFIHCTGTIWSTDGQSSPGFSYSSDSNLVIYEGIVVRGIFTGTIYDSPAAIWNGNIHYSTPDAPTKPPTNMPTVTPSLNPTISPTTNQPTTTPTMNPAMNPTVNPGLNPITVNPSTMNPTVNPTMNPTTNPITMTPTVNPTVNPTVTPTMNVITVNPSTKTPTTPIIPVTSISAISTTQSFVSLDCDYMNNGFKITLSFDYELLMNTSNTVITNNLLNLTHILISKLTQCPISNYDTNIILNKPNHANIYISLCTDCNDSSIQQNLMTEFIIQNILSVVENSTKIDVEVIKTGQDLNITSTITSSIQNEESEETIKNENNSFWIVVYIVIALIVTCIICLCIIMIWKYKKTNEMHSRMVDNIKNDVNMIDINSNSDNVMSDEYMNAESDIHDKDVAPGSVVNVNDEIIIESETEDDDKKITKGDDDMSTKMSKENSNDLVMIKEWLEYKVCLIKYFNNFVDNGYDSMDFIKAISDRQQLEEIGIIIPGHKTKILTEIKKLANNMSGILDENTQQQHEGRDEAVINDIYPTPKSTN
eukprot:195669_1